jgi:copper chaperone CopZ
MGVVALLGAALVFGCGKYNENTPIPETKEVATASIQKVKLDVQGMVCTGCEIGVETALKKLAGVTGADADFASKSAEVEFDPQQVTVDKLVEAVNKTGFTAKAPQLN